MRLHISYVPTRALFVVHTNSYSGNFEREIGGFMTGQVGECEVGSEQAELFTESNPSAEIMEWLEEHVAQAPDEHGCHRPVIMIPTPGVFNDGHGNEWPDDADPEEVRVKYEETVRKTYGEYMSRTKVQSEIDRHNQTIQDSIERGPGKHYAYQSVGILLDEKPPQEVIDFLKERAKLFTQQKPINSWDKYHLIQIKGFELAVRPETYIEAVEV